MDFAMLKKPAAAGRRAKATYMGSATSSIDGWATAVATLPIGPQTSAEIWDYPIDQVVALTADQVHGAKHRNNLLQACKRGLVGTSHFSGYDTPRECLRLGSTGLEAIVSLALPVAWASCCDKDRGCRVLLERMSAEVDASESCVFCNIEDRLPTQAKEALDKCESKTNGKNSKSELAAAIDARRQQREYVFNNLASTFPDSAMSFCTVHNQRCSTLPSRDKAKEFLPKKCAAEVGADADGPGPMIVNFAGTPCVAYSPAGNQLREADATERIHAVWAGERKAASMLHRCEDLFVSECSHLYMAQEKLSALQKSHTIVSVQTSPHRLGFPTNRLRTFTAGVSLETMVWVGPPAGEVQSSFDALFNKACVLTGEEYFIAPTEEIIQEQIAMARARGTHLTTSHGLSPAEIEKAMLPPGLLRRIQAHTDGMMQGLGGPFIADIKDAPQFTCGGSKWPALLRNSQIRSWQHARLAVVGEYFASMGVHYYDNIAGAYGVSPLSNVVRDSVNDQQLKTGVVKTMVGNAMHVGTFLAWILYVLANVTPRQHPAPQPTLSSSPAAHQDDAEDEESQVQPVQHQDDAEEEESQVQPVQHQDDAEDEESQVQPVQQQETEEIE